MNDKPDPVCPACGATFEVADRRKRVQCPRCLEVVELGAAKPAARPIPVPAAKELAELKGRLARLDELEARTAALERELAELRAARWPRVPVAPFLAVEPAAGPELAWHQPPPSEPTTLPGDIAPAQRATLVSNLAALGARRVVLRAAPADPLAHQLAERFRDVFTEAGWTPSPVQEAPGHLRRHPLVLTAPTNATPQEMAVLYMALAAAGLQLVSQIDPTLGGRDPLLSIGPHA